MSWVDFWDGNPSVYVSPRHKIEHYNSIADGIIHYLPSSEARVLDYGCGEALAAERVAAHCRRLTLCDAAPSVVSALTQRYAGNAAIASCTPQALAALPDGAFDLIVVNSVVQYLDEAAFSALLSECRRLLVPEGRVLFADIIPPDLNPLGDAAQLLKFSANRGFLIAAAIGLVRTALSGYTALRKKLGFAKYSHEAFMTALARGGFSAEPTRPNLGHNQLRLAYLARPATSAAG